MILPQRKRARPQVLNIPPKHLLIVAFIANRSSKITRGKHNGLFNFTFSVSMVVSPALGAWIYESYGPKTLWLSVGILGFLLFGGFVVVNQLLHQERQLQTERS